MADVTEITQKDCTGIFDGLTTSALEDLATDTTTYVSAEHHDYSLLASSIAVSNLHKDTTKSFSETVEMLHSYVS